MCYKKSHGMKEQIEITPATREKKELIDRLRKEYIQLFTRRDHLLSHERDTLFCRYMLLVGQRKYENYKISVDVRALKMKLELAQAALNRNERPNLAKIEDEVNRQLQSYYRDLERQAEEVRLAQEAVAIADFTIEELRNLYRTLVRRLHPDLHPNLPESLQDLFVKGVAAYRSYDIATLRGIVKRLDMDSPLDDIAREGESPEETIARLQKDIEKQKSENCKLKTVFPFNLEMQLQDPVWVKAEQDKLDDEHHRLEEQKRVYRDRLSLIFN